MRQPGLEFRSDVRDVNDEMTQHKDREVYWVILKSEQGGGETAVLKVDSELYGQTQCQQFREELAKAEYLLTVFPPGTHFYDFLQ